MTGEQFDFLYEAALTSRLMIFGRILFVLLFFHKNCLIQDRAQRDCTITDDLRAQHVDADQFGQIEAGHVENDELDHILRRIRGRKLIALLDDKRTNADLFAADRQRLVGRTVEAYLNERHQFLLEDELVERELVNVEHKDAQRKLHHTLVYLIA